MVKWLAIDFLHHSMYKHIAVVAVAGFFINGQNEFLSTNFVCSVTNSHSNVLGFVE